MSDNDDKPSRFMGERGGLPSDPSAVARVTSIKEDEPTMRSMPIVSDSSPNHLQHAALPQKFPSTSQLPQKMPQKMAPSIDRATTIPQRSIPQPASLASTIDKTTYFKQSNANAIQGRHVLAQQQISWNEKAIRSNWIPRGLRPVPAYYPLEKSSRFISEDDKCTIAARVSDCLRVLSVHANYDNDAATASLHTGEHVEMHLSLWKGAAPKCPDGVIVELQRRKGDSVAFHRYSRHILDAAVGDFDPSEYIRLNAEGGERSYSKMAERLLTSEVSKGSTSERENSLIALEIAASLLRKDRMDARQLGMESLCLLTDPQKTSLGTAKIASQVVLLGMADESPSPGGDDLLFDESSHFGIREAILSLVQFRRLGEDCEFGAGFDEKDDDEYDSDDDVEDRHPEEKQHMDTLHNLALAVLANALDVMENLGKENETKPAAVTADSFMSEATKKKDILATLIAELGKAEITPHDACLSAKCLGCLCRASDDARRRAREMKAMKVVSTALDVGQRTHAKLETEAELVVKTLARDFDADE